MKAQRAFTLFLFMMALSYQAQAGISDPNAIVEDSHRVLSQPRQESVVEKVTGKVKGWWDTAKKTITGDTSKSAVAKNKPSGKKLQAERKKEAVESLAETMPKFKTPNKGFKPADIEKARETIAPGLTRVIDKGAPAQADIPKSPRGVPQYPLFDAQQTKDKSGKVKTVYVPKKEIPRLNVGREARVSKNDFMLPHFKFSLAQHKDPQALKSPAMVPGPDISRFTAKPIVAAQPLPEFKDLRLGVEKPVTKETVGKIVWKITRDNPINLQAYKPLSEPEQKMLAALILYKKGGQCHFVIGLFDQIAKDTKVEDEAKFHLGSCSHTMKLYSSSFKILSDLIKRQHPDYTTEALKILSADLPQENEIDFYELVKNVNAKWIPDSIRDQVSYLAAKGAFKAGKYKAAKTWASKVQESSVKFPNAQYIVGISHYSLGQKKTAINKLEGLRAWMKEKNITDKNLNSLTALNLARVKFNSAQYKDAHELYMKVDKDHPTWVQALIEQGWTQLSMEDYSGAIGNMYSLHSPYFTAVYKPESFVVRSIGYLNICQYGDAYKTLTHLENDYSKWFSLTKNYISNKKLASDYHETVVTYLKGKSDSDVDGLPFQVVREMARQKYYLNKQAALNEKLDEIARHKGIDEKIKEEKARIRWRLQKAQERFATVRSNIKKTQATKEMMADINSLKAQYRTERDHIIGYRYQLAMLELGRQGFLAFKEKSENRIGKEQYALKEGAGRFLVSYLKKLKDDMSQIIDNNEFLRYEVFAGSGENIRYQVAGGTVSGEANRIPASIKPQKMMNWNFDGEYWEDEIGAYRSSLQNLCPDMGKAENANKKKDQASLSKEYIR